MIMSTNAATITGGRRFLRGGSSGPAFLRRGYLSLDFLRPRILADTAIAPWYRYNTLLYVSGDAMTRLSPALQACQIPQAAGVPDLAPLSYRIRKFFLSRLTSPVMQ